MVNQVRTSTDVRYFLNENGCFVIENYNHSKLFSNFFPGIAGLWGIPMWVFYVNRGQCLTSFGIESKDKAIMEFQPANKAYRLTSLQGFRTFIKCQQGDCVKYWEPFQDYILGSEYQKETSLYITAHDLTLQEINHDLGLIATVNYFTLPEEPFSALVRKVTIKNMDGEAKSLQVIDGLPKIVPYGLNDWLIKHISRTVEAWVKVRNCENKAPFYHLTVEVSDTPEVTHIDEGNFFFSFDPSHQDKPLLDPIVEADCVFGASSDFIAPAAFLEESFAVPNVQRTSNRTPSAMSYMASNLPPHAEKSIVSLFGFAYDQDQLNGIVEQVKVEGFIDQKAQRNIEIINEIKHFSFTKSSDETFNLYAGCTFLDNIMRGGLPVSLKTSEGKTVINVYSRKHGDLERDYNHFIVAPTFYSQGNGNYRDVNQNRRNDVWFNTDVKDSHLIDFMNLIQADGYNPLVIRGTTFTIKDKTQIDGLLKKYITGDLPETLKPFLEGNFLLGSLLEFIHLNKIQLKGVTKDFLGEIIEMSRKQETADHGEGFWSDHWTYNLDLMESYLALYPEELESLLIEKNVFFFYFNKNYVLPRDQKYVLTPHGVRQYKSVYHAPATDSDTQEEPVLKTKNGDGAVYMTTLMSKILCLIANKSATLDPSGVGVEMEADKPNWYDALNGLPGLVGSSISETFELKRITVFLLESIKKLALKDDLKIMVFEELSTFISGLTNILSFASDDLAYWIKSNDIKEHYRQRIRQGIEGTEKELSISEIRSFLTAVIKKTDQAIEKAYDDQGFLRTYFYHDVVEYQMLDKSGHSSDTPYVHPTKFQLKRLPLFLEGYVHALRVSQNDPDTAAKLYQQVRESDLYDNKLGMYKVNTDLSGETEEIGRTRIFPSGWLENESIWLHMEYKFLLELLRSGQYEAFYDNIKTVLVPFLRPETYGRSTLENSSFIVSSAHEDDALHGQGFVARLSGSTAEFLHIWLCMNVGVNPFYMDAQSGLNLIFKPALAGWLFTDQDTLIGFLNHEHQWEEVSLPANIYAFNFLGSMLVVYHNPKRKDTFGPDQARVSGIHLTYTGKKKPVVVNSARISAPHAQDVRDKRVSRIDVYFV
ncbi:MAG: hypothetical protein K8S27_08510 [Candidatus Omnitrophica bacterium]|nr:hypothetical protein [Candidatus Omnitrophota bacterium]